MDQFTEVDASADPGHYVQLMERASAVDGIALCRRRAIEALALRPGARVLDLGCGPGDAAAELAALVGAGGEVVGVDYSETMVSAAVDRHGGSGLPLRFAVGNACKLEYADGEFDACRTERMLCHVPDAPAALAEMARVTRPGGRVVVLDADIDTIVIDPADRAVLRALTNGLADTLANGLIGRQLQRLMRAAGLADVTVDARLVDLPLAMARLLLDAQLEVLVAGGTVTAAQRDGFWAGAEEAERRGDLYAGFCIFLVAGTRP